MDFRRILTIVVDDKPSRLRSLRTMTGAVEDYSDKTALVSLEFWNAALWITQLYTTHLK